MVEINNKQRPNIMFLQPSSFIFSDPSLSPHNLHPASLLLILPSFLLTILSLLYPPDPNLHVYSLISTIYYLFYILFIIYYL